MSRVRLETEPLARVTLFASSTVGVAQFAAAPSVLKYSTPDFGSTCVLPRLTCGVGHDPDTFAALGRAALGSRKHIPARIIPERGQVAEYSSEKPGRDDCAASLQMPDGKLAGEEPGNIFEYEYVGSKRANGSDDGRPEIALVLGGGALPGDAVGLAGESGTEDVNALDLVKVQGGGVAVDRHLGPVMREHVAAERINLTKPARHPALRLGRHVEAADAGEQGADGRHAPRCGHSGGASLARPRVSRTTSPNSSARMPNVAPHLGHVHEVPRA